MSNALALKISCNAAPLIVALASLKEIAERAPELVERFLHSLNSSSQLCRIDSDVLLAAGAGESGITFQPSDLLAEFLAAGGAGDFEGVGIDIELHGSSSL